jgi:hypothetical protein
MFRDYYLLLLSIILITIISRDKFGMRVAPRCYDYEYYMTMRYELLLLIINIKQSYDYYELL